MEAFCVVTAERTSLIGQIALDYAGLLPPGTQFDLFKGAAAVKADEEESYPTTLGHLIKVCAPICLEPYLSSNVRHFCYSIYVAAQLQVIEL